MMPVDGESSAAVQNTSGSRAATAPASSHCRSSTPFAAALVRIPSSVAFCASLVATISLPQRACGTPRSAQYSYRRPLPATQVRALSEPVG